MNQTKRPEVFEANWGSYLRNLIVILAVDE
jgi:hypothetical protein